MPRRQRRNSSAKELHRRDKGVCGAHIDGCGKEISQGQKSSADHLIPQAVIATLTSEQDRKMLTNNLINQQVMHASCNNARWGTLQGTMPQFKCKCHAILVDNEGYMCLVTSIAPHKSTEETFYSVRLIQRAPHNNAVVHNERARVYDDEAVGYMPNRFGHVIHIPDATDAGYCNIAEWIRTGWDRTIAWKHMVIRGFSDGQGSMRVWAELPHGNAPTSPTGLLATRDAVTGAQRVFIGWLSQNETKLDAIAHHARHQSKAAEFGKVGIVWSKALDRVLAIDHRTNPDRVEIARLRINMEEHQLEPVPPADVRRFDESNYQPTIMPHQGSHELTPRELAKNGWMQDSHDQTTYFRFDDRGRKHLVIHAPPNWVYVPPRPSQMAVSSETPAGAFKVADESIYLCGEDSNPEYGPATYSHAFVQLD